MLKRLISYTYASLFFFIPLILWPKTFEVFEFNKMMLVYLIAGVVVFLWSTRCLLEKRFIFKKTPLDLPLTLFLISQILATIFSIDPHTSLWGYYSRFHGGLFSTVSYLILFYGLVSNLDQTDLDLLIFSIVGTTALVVLYAILEHFGIDKDLWVQDVQNRVFSTLGQPNWLSAYLIAIFPLVFYSGMYGRSVLRPYYLAFSLTILLAIWFTKSQSGLAATALILFAVTCHQAFTRFKPAFFLLIPALIVTLYFQLPRITKIISLYQKPIAVLVQEEAATRVGGSDSMLIRRVVWQGALDLFKRRPIFGTGVETFAYSYYWTRPPAHNLLSEWDFLYNKAHNEYLNFLSTTGAVGLISYLFLIGSTLYLFLYGRSALRPYDLLFGYLSILITNFFGFSVVPVALLFFLFPALALLKNYSPEKTTKQNFSPDIIQIVLISVISLLVLSWSFTIIQHWRADVKYNRGKVLLEAGYVGNALPLLETAVKLYSDEPTFRAYLAQGYAQAAYALNQQYPSTYVAQKEQYSQKSVHEINQVIKENRYHLNFYRTKAQIELILASLDGSFVQNAQATLYKANELAPTDAKILFNIGIINSELNQKEQAKIAFQKALELKPNYDQARLQLDILTK